MSEPDPHTLLFGADDEIHGPDDPAFDAEPAATRPTRSSRHRGADAARRRRARRRGRLVVLLSVVVVAVLAGGGYVYLRDAIMVKDYSGTGTTSVRVSISSGDTASAIAQRLLDAGVVESTKAFTNAANDDPNSQDIQPGTYTLRRHMSAKSALLLLLDPSSRSAGSDVVVTEGATSVDVAARLAKGLGVPVEKVRAAMADVGQLNLPSTYTAGGGEPRSVEGFLYPATYTLEPGDGVTDVLSKMINKFVAEDRSTGFATRAKALQLTPYEALIIASIAQSEAKFPEDMPKVARVILNRLAARRPLQIDATSAYAAKLQGLDPAKVVYSTIDSPYNSYTHDGLPPTPLGNPGDAALAGAVNPPPGNWMFYVNGDKAGHLFFTDSEAAFTRAVAKCRQNNWGCA